MDRPIIRSIVVLHSEFVVLAGHDSLAGSAFMQDRCDIAAAQVEDLRVKA